MISHSPIGGYFELELRKESFLYPEAVLLNTGRNCFEYILRANNVKRIHIPKYTCDVMLEPLHRLKLPYSFYSINDRLELSRPVTLADGDMLLYTNYFGLKGEYSLQLSNTYKDRLILDCSQAFYFPPLAVGHTFYSPRKFFGLPDGGALVTSNKLTEDLPRAISHERASHLLKRIDLGAEAGFAEYQQNDRSLSGQPLMKMSRLTERLLANIDFEGSRKIRERNFAHLHRKLGAVNKMQMELAVPSGPMVYPYLTNDAKLRQKLIQERVYIATYWPNVLEWCDQNEVEYGLARNILPLPIDQRYSDSDMERLVKLLDESTN